MKKQSPETIIRNEIIQNQKIIDLKRYERGYKEFYVREIKRLKAQLKKEF